jgi:type IV secretory pathway VirJ component
MKSTPKINNSQNLAQAAKDIKDLLDQLDRDYDRTTPTGQAMISAKTIEAIEKNPAFKARIINALKEGGTTALETAIDHPAIKPVVAMLKGFMDTK